MSQTRLLYVQGMENHLELIEVQQDLIRIGQYLLDNRGVAGNEELAVTVAEAAKTLGSGLFSVVKWMGGQTLDIFVAALGKAGNALSHTFSDNQTLIKKILQQLNSKEELTVEIPKSTLGLITSKGDIDDISRDMDALLEALAALDKHCDAVADYLDRQLIAAKKLKGASTTEGILSVVEEFEKLKYPMFELPKKNGDTRETETLPGGRVWEFELKDGAPTYLMHGDTPAEAGSSITLSKSEVSAMLNKLDKINSMHKHLKQAYERYLGFIKAWADMVKSVEPNLSKLDRVSRGVLGQAEKVLAGDTHALAFYSGFAPRVVSYTDRYIHGVLGVFA